MLRLIPRRRRVPRARSPLFARRGVVVDPVRTAIVSNAIRIQNRVLLYNRSVHIGVVDDRDIHLSHRGVVRKHAASPLAAGKPDPAKPKSVVDPAIVADIITPIAIMEAVNAVGPPPIRRRPQRAFVWSRDPCPRHPVVIPVILGIGPVARCPHQVLFGARRLLIHRKNRGCEIDTDTHSYAELRVQNPRAERYKQSKQKQAENAKSSHKLILLSLFSKTLRRSLRLNPRDV